MTGSLQVKNDKYYAVLNFQDDSGKRAQKWISLGLELKGNKRRAEAKLNDLLVQYQGIEPISPLRQLLSRHIQSWIEGNRSNVAVTTYNQYINMLANHIGPYFDELGITLDNVTAGDLEDYYTFKVAEGLSPNSVIKHHAIIRTALQWAVKHRYIRENVADLATRPGRVKFRGPGPYSVEEVANLLNLTQHESIAAPIFLSAFYGLRRSEVLGLRWSAIDFENDCITISATVVKEKDGENIVAVFRDNTTKTDDSMRTLPLCTYTYQYLAALYQKQQQQRALCGESYNTQYHDFVCVDLLGNLLQPDYVSQKFQQLLNYYGLRRIRYHDLRHSCATIMLYLGCSMKDIQTWLGHSNYNFTADTYVHSSPVTHAQMADTFSRKLVELLPQNPMQETQDQRKQKIE